MSPPARSLRYSADSEPGLHRRAVRGRVEYRDTAGKRVTARAALDRIKQLAIPPAWTEVWICAHANGHLQATGTDTRQRKQYKYHPQWVALRNSTKFYRMLDFGKALPSIRERVAADLALPGLPAQKVLALVVALMENTGIRVGSGFYEKLYGSFGLTTLKDKHVTIGGDKVKFIFTGKKGVKHSITLQNKKLAAIVKQCRDIPGKDLFQYYEGNEHKTIDSGMVNAYIKAISGSYFTAKDFRTWNGTASAFCALCDLGCAKNKKELQKNIVEALNVVAKPSTGYARQSFALRYVSHHAACVATSVKLLCVRSAMACAARASLTKPSATIACRRASADSSDDTARSRNASTAATGCSRHASAAKRASQRIGSRLPMSGSNVE